MNKLLQQIIKAGLLSSIFVAVLYFFGYLFLSFYFKSFGLLINISDINFRETILIGIPVFITGIFIFYLIFLIIKLFLKRIKVKLQGFIIIIILFFISQILGNFFLSTWIYNHDYVYNYFLKFHNKLPVIEIIYSTPLIINNDKKINIENNLECETLKVKSIKTGETWFQINNRDNFFYDQSGTIKYFRAFTLFFSTDEFYYLFPNKNFSTPVNFFSEILFEDVECDGKKIDNAKHISQTIVSGEGMYSLIILPKNKVESIKFLGEEENFKSLKY